MIITGTLYDTLKRIVQVILPAFSALYFGLAAIWNLPAAEQVVGTCAVIATFLGVCLGISSKNYEASGAAYDGQMVVTEPEDGSKKFLLQLDSDLEELEGKKAVTFKVAALGKDASEQ